MKNLILISTLFAAMFSTGNVQAGIFGRRGTQTTNGYRSNSRQPAPQFPFNSRSDPRDWHEAHRGYGVKIRGW